MIPVALHTHTRVGSNDGDLWPHDIVREYRKMGFGAVVLTDHDAATDAPDVGGILSLTGVEHTVDAESHMHVVEIPPLDFRFLAHPGLPLPENTRDRAAAYARENGLDGVEKFNGATKHYDGSIPDLHEIASDDAHNAFQVGHSYITVPEQPTSAAVLREQLHSGRYELVHDPGMIRSHLGRVTKGVRVATHEAARAFGGVNIPGKKTVLYDRRGRR